ncbi:uncharacterized protein OCT59_020786 [Rhizophagus irregularis]|uniref:uncharacterized protein n=1 Tax=Rhizophagus irregularis TaxID=588596 RepID=UPI003328B7BA|nr:hypothetical protein OCT59_020786 [Rhizophagus irregularis]
MIILPSGETLIWKAVDISNQRGRAIDVIPKIEEILKDLKEQSIKVAAFVSNSAAAYASACLIRIKQALRLLVMTYEPPEETLSRSTELYLPTDICQIIMGDLF